VPRWSHRNPHVRELTITADCGGSEVGSDLVITATPNDVLTLKNVALASIDAADLRFVS
jgi:hypothetical protein